MTDLITLSFIYWCYSKRIYVAWSKNSRQIWKKSITLFRTNSFLFPFFFYIVKPLETLFNERMMKSRKKNKNKIVLFDAWDRFGTGKRIFLRSIARCVSMGITKRLVWGCTPLPISIYLPTPLLFILFSPLFSSLPIPFLPFPLFPFSSLSLASLLELPIPELLWNARASDRS